MIYETYSVGGELYHARSHKYIDKIKTKAGKWRYIYKNTLNYGRNKHIRDMNTQKYEEFINGKYDKGLRDPQDVNNWYISPKKALELKNSKYFKSYYNDPKRARQTKLERRDLQDEIKVNKLHKGDENYNRTHYAVDVQSSWGDRGTNKKPGTRFKKDTENHRYGTYEEIEAAKAKESALEMKEEYDKKLSAVEEESEELMAQARKAAKARESEIISEADAEAHRIITRAEKEASLEKDKVKDEIKQEIVQVATQMAGRFVENSMDEKTQAALVDETLKEMGDATWQS